ncbi:site-specific DNA-methyltransferase [Anaerococcus sp. AGMB09787]|uniref:site-specific DNA-methyltransferase n=1 Tax=Anaerococcus sp. AGMB09787 TaxID=2922869 RepID=UPI001FB01E72|nr:site-specific DNA-methyltransferase [Anaerococcus sp. AGMB09787]
MIGNNIEENLEKKPNSREIEKLKNEFPQFFDKDGEFLVDRFKEMLKQSDITLNKEGYELKFLGKSYARYLSSTKTETFVAPHTEENQKEENKDSENLYIIGDNLDALKHLLGSYGGKIKCIYIDPPYNTGSDGFVYPDNFSFDAKKLAEMIGIEEDEAERIINLKGKSSHSAWLTFMYPRLILARELLSDDGVIFISIDDNEQANLRLMCDEIFGEENFVDTLIWKGKGGGQDSTFYVKSYEYILCYARNISEFKLSTYEIEEDDKSFNYYDEERKLKYKRQLARKWGSNARREDRPNLYFPVIAPDGTEVYPRLSDGTDGSWRHNRLRLQREIENGEFEFIKNKDNEWILYQKIFASKDGKKVKKFTNIIEDVSSGAGTKSLKDLFDGISYFDYPKPVSLIKKLISMIDDEFIVLDFFSGSATTAHAVMQLNAEDGGNRKYIMVQLAEEIKENKPAYKAGYRTIDEIGRERIRRAAQKIKDETGADIDYGFKTYSLEELDEDTLTKLDYFDDNPKLIVDDMVGIFDTENAKGKDAILATYLVLDGYGLSVNPESYKLDQYTADKLEKSLYIIDQGLQSTDVMELIRRIESLELDITRVVVYAQSIDFSVMNELKKNLSNLRNNKTVELIERY